MPIAILLAPQRSGTHALKEVLNSHPNVVSYPEVFHSDSVEIPTEMFWTFYLKEVKRNARIALPDARIGCIERYFDMLEKFHHDETTVLDIKYNSLHHGEGYWSPYSGPPKMFNTFRQRNYPVIHLWRCNLLRRQLSEMRANQTGQFHLYKEGESIPLKMQVNCKFVLKKLRSYTEWYTVVRTWLAGHKPLTELTYEDLWHDEDGDLKPDTVKKLSACLQVDPAGFNRKPNMFKVSPSNISEMVLNVKELEEALAGTEFAWMLESDTPPVG